MMTTKNSGCKMLFGVFCIIFCSAIFNFACGAPSYNENDLELVLVHGIFRHGARTTYGFYPTDPHRNNTFYPIGLGGLTNEGKIQEFELGRYLRKDYRHFLDEIYSQEVIEVRSTGVERTIMSAQLLMAGLFPPVKHQIWNKELPWQPVPIFFRAESEEDILHPKFCAYRQKVEGNLTNNPNVQELYIKPFKYLFDYVNLHSGLNITSVHDLLEFYFIISTEAEMNLTLPKWIKSIYPEPVHSTGALTYNYLNYDRQLRILNMGYLLQKMINDTKLKMNGDAFYEKQKMYLYSGHEITLGFFLDALKVLEPPHVPPYAGIILLEIWKNKSDQYFVKLRYKKGHHSNGAETLKIPECSSLCPWESFLKITDKLLPKVSVKETCDM